MLLRYLLEKEFRQIRRNGFLPRLIVIYPIVMILVMPWAATLEIDDLRIAVIDHDRSALSERLVHRIEASPYFKLTSWPDSYRQGLESIEKDEADLLLEIPYGFEKEVTNGRRIQTLVAVNAVNGTKGGLGSNYLQQIIRQNQPDISLRYLYNPYLDYKIFMIPALMTILIVMFCGFLPSLNVVGEKEKGTIEQLNVTPVSRFQFTLAKLIPYWIVGFLVLNLCLVLTGFIYGFWPQGNLLLIYLITVVFSLVMSGLGLVISNYSATMQQAMFVMWFCMLIFILMSGLFTPIGSMPGWAQYITSLNPLRYFVESMRMVYLKGSGIADIAVRLYVLSGMAAVCYFWAIVSYRKQK